MLKRILYLLFTLFGLQSCIKIPESDSVLYYEVRENANGGKIISTINDRNKIGTLTAFIKEQNKGWYSPISTLPAAQYDFLFYDKNKALIFPIGVGSDFLVHYKEQKIKSADEKIKSEWMKYIR